MALACSQQPWPAILGGEMGTARPSQRSERPVPGGAHKVPFVPAWATLPKSARAARRAVGDRRKAEPSRLSLSHRV